jgi:hypothetical protein
VEPEAVGDRAARRDAAGLEVGDREALARAPVAEGEHAAVRVGHRGPALHMAAVVER